MGRIRFFGNKAHGSVRIGNNAGLLDGEVIVIGDKTYEWDNDVSVTLGNILVTIGGDAATSIANLVAAINANKPTPPVDASIDPIDTATARIQATNRGAAGNLAFTETMADGTNVISGSGNLEGGENGGQQTLHRDVYTVTAIDVSAGNIMIPTGIPNTPRFRQVDFYNSVGVQRNDVTAEVKLVGTDLQVEFAGAVDLVAGDLVVWQVWE